MAKRPNSGDLHHLLSFQKQGTAVDSYGGTTSAWAAQFTCHGGFVHLRGGEGVQAARLEGRHVQVIRVRASTNTRSVTPEWRIADSRTGDVFNIRDVEPGEDRQFIDFLCEKGVAA